MAATCVDHYLLHAGKVWNGLLSSHAVPSVHTLTLLLVTLCVYYHLYVLPCVVPLFCHSMFVYAQFCMNTLLL